VDGKYLNDDWYDYMIPKGTGVDDGWFCKSVTFHAPTHGLKSVSVRFKPTQVGLPFPTCGSRFDP